MMKSLFISFLFMCSVLMVGAQETEQTKRLPIIDIHVHAMKVSPGMSMNMCPWFLSDMPGGDPNEPMAFSFEGDCIDPLIPAQSDEEMLESIVHHTKDLNMTMVAFGDAETLHKWVNASPKGSIIPGIGISNATSMTVEAFRDSLETGFYKVMAECAPQYQGISPSDPALDPYFAVAEEMNIPVGIHMGTGGNGMANITQPNYRASLGDPLLLEDLLARHPKLKVYVHHAGYPFADEMIALMGANAYVYVDISGFIWSYPLDEIHYYIKRLVQAGFGKRICYGTDFMMYPKLFETGIGVIENAQYLSEDQKRDILFNNSARFLNLDESYFDWPE